LLFSSNPPTLETMRGASILLLAAAAGAGTFAFPRQAAALGPIDLEVGARAGYGSNPIKDAALNPLGAGIGGRAGVSFFGIYAGLSLMYYFGGSANVPEENPATGAIASTKVTGTSFLYGLEAGYNFNILFLTLRPQIGVGNYQLHTSISNGGGSSDEHNIYIEPRATALIGIGLFYFGADVGVLLTPGLADSKAAVLVNGQLGLKF
jgi:hypothetical protein